MNKPNFLQKKASWIAILGLALANSACNIISYEDEYVSSPYDVFVQKNKNADTDGYFNKESSVKFTDNLGIGDVFDTKFQGKAEDFYGFSYSGKTNEISGGLFLQCDKDGGYISFTCNAPSIAYSSEGINFSISQKDKLENKDGYTIEYKDSLEINGKTYDYVLIVGKKNTKKDKCNFERLYISRDDGLLQIDVNDTISLVRDETAK